MTSFSPSAALALLLLASCASAATPLQAFTAQSFEPDATVQASALLVNGSFYLVSSSGNETYVVDASNGSAIMDISLLISLLRQDAQNRASYESKVSSAVSFPSVVNAAKNATEAKCLQYIGDDGDPGCTDRQSCLVSCFSVPQCEIIVQADGFLDSSMEWDSSRKEFSSLLLAYSDGIDSVRSDQQAIDGKISILSSLSSLAANMSQNNIFLSKADAGCSGKNSTRRCYDYCPKIDYSASRILSQSQDLASLKAALSDIAGQGARAEGIMNRSLENDAYLSSRGTRYEEFRLMMKNGIRTLKADSSELASKVSDPLIAPSISQLENISEKAINYSDSGYYKKALALRHEFEALSNSTSGAIVSDGKRYSALMLAMAGFSDKAKSSAWLIGNSSAVAYLSRLASLKANYSAPLTLSRISEAGAALSGLGNSLDSEISSKAVQAGNSTSPPPPQQPALPCLPALISPAVILLAFALARRRV